MNDTKFVIGAVSNRKARTNIREWMREHCHVFDESEEHKIEYTLLFKEYEVTSM